MDKPTPKTPRVTRLCVGRLCNLGNYEHIRYEVTVDIPEGGNAGATLLALEDALAKLCAKQPNPPFCGVARARELLALPVDQVPEQDRNYLNQHKRDLGHWEDWHTEREAARQALNDLGVSSEFTDHKLYHDEP